MSRKIATLWDEKEAEDHEGQAFYAGGSEHSGQQILGPDQGSSSNSERLVENLFNHARQSAAFINDPNENQTAATASNTLPVTFWRNGFTVGEDDELRDYDSEANRQFIEQLQRGETPAELMNRVRGGMIDLKMDKKMFQDYKPERKAFSATNDTAQTSSGGPDRAAMRAAAAAAAEKRLAASKPATKE